MCPVLVHFPIDWIKVPFCDVIVLTAYLYSALSRPPSAVTGHPKGFLSGFVVAFRYSILNHITSPVVMHANEYTPA